MTKDAQSPNEKNGGGNRRGFLGSVVAIVGGLVALAVPTAAGIATFLGPLRERSQSGRRVRLGSLDALPADGTPVKIPVIADHTDAWMRFPPEPIGAVFLRRTDKGVTAFQASCPHAGCSIDFQTSSKGGRFFCPCHCASFDLAGQRTDAASPSPRDMDALRVEVLDKNEVWVEFETFAVGTARKVAQG